MIIYCVSRFGWMDLGINSVVCYDFLLVLFLFLICFVGYLCFFMLLDTDFGWWVVYVCELVACLLVNVCLRYCAVFSFGCCLFIRLLFCLSNSVVMILCFDMCGYLLLFSMACCYASCVGLFAFFV